MNCRFALLVAFALLAGIAARRADADEGQRREQQAARQKHFEETIQPFLTRYCYDCHSDGADSPLKLDQFTKASEISTTGFKAWKNVHDKLYAHAMPPEDADLPPQAERDAVVAWIKETLDDYDCSGPTNPGRTTLRRLSRFEYKNTIRDLRRRGGTRRRFSDGRCRLRVRQHRRRDDAVAAAL
jgi:hypothetical protein